MTTGEWLTVGAAWGGLLLGIANFVISRLREQVTLSLEPHVQTTRQGIHVTITITNCGPYPVALSAAGIRYSMKDAWFPNPQYRQNGSGGRELVSGSEIRLPRDSTVEPLSRITICIELHHDDLPISHRISGVVVRLSSGRVWRKKDMRFSRDLRQAMLSV